MLTNFLQLETGGTMSHLSVQDFKIAIELIEEDEVFKPIKRMPELSNAHPRKSIFVGCPDCDQLKSVMVFHGQEIGQKLHGVGMVHGGGAAFSSLSPINRACPHSFPIEWFEWKIREEAGVLKQTSTISWYSHAPCGAAYSYNLSLPAVVELHFACAVAFWKNARTKNGERFLIRPYFHIDFGNLRSRRNGSGKDKKTYWSDFTAWMYAREKYMDAIRTLPKGLILSPEDAVASLY